MWNQPSLIDAARRRLVLPVARHDVAAARDDLAHARRRVGLGDLDLDARQRLAHRADDGLVLGRRHREDGRRLGEAVALEEVEAEAVEGLEHVGRQRRAARDEVADAPAEALVNGQEHEHAEIDLRARAQLVVRRHEALHEGLEHGRLLGEALHEAAAHELPQRGHAHDGGDAALLERAADGVARELGEVGDLRAVRERHEQARRELEGVVTAAARTACRR